MSCLLHISHQYQHSCLYFMFIQWNFCNKQCLVQFINTTEEFEARLADLFVRNRSWSLV